MIPSLTAHAGVPSHGSILRSFSGRILTSTAEAPSRKGDQGDEGWHHNQVWAAGGAVIRPHLEMGQSHFLQGQEAKRNSSQMSIRLSLLIPMYTELQSAQRTRVSAAPTAEMQKLVEVATKNAAPRVSSKGKNKRIPKNFFWSPATDVAGE